MRFDFVSPQISKQKISIGLNGCIGDPLRPNDRIFLVVNNIHVKRGPDLFEIAQTLGFPRAFTCIVQRRQQHRRENRYDGDHDEELDQGE